MHSSLPQVSIGILTYCGKKYFPFLLPALFQQTYPHLEILVLDNASPEEDAIFLREQYDQKITVFQSEENLGFAEGHNFLIRRMSGAYYLCLNQDVLLEPDYIAALVQECSKTLDIGSATGKLRRWDFGAGRTGKTEILDSTGIRVTRAHHFTDRGQGERDQGQYDIQTEIFAPSAAAALYRREALENIATKNAQGEKEYFDARFFMYKEDLDLGYRLRWAGWDCIYVSRARAFHDRTAAQERPGFLGLLSGQKRKSRAVRERSWINQRLLLKKNFSPDFSWSIKWRTWCYQFCTGLYLLIFDPKLFFAARQKFRKLTQGIDFQKNRSRLARISVQKMERFFQ